MVDKLLEDLNWIAGEFERLSYLVDVEFSISSEDSKEISSNRDRVNSIVDSVISILQLGAISPHSDDKEIDRYARALCAALEASDPDALVEGHADINVRSTIDGRFVLGDVVRDFLNAFAPLRYQNDAID